MEQVLRQTWAFFFRDYHLTRRYLSWVVVFTFYAVVNSATIALIGVAAGDRRLTLTLIVGVLLVELPLGALSGDSQLDHLRALGGDARIHLHGAGLAAHAPGGREPLRARPTASCARSIIVAGLLLFVDLDLSRRTAAGLFVVLVVSSAAFIGLGLMAAVLPVFSPERGAEATNIFQGILLLVSGVYYPVEVLPRWLQPLSVVSPATYALSREPQAHRHRRARGELGAGRAALGGRATSCLCSTLMGVVDRSRSASTSSGSSSVGQADGQAQAHRMKKGEGGRGKGEALVFPLTPSPSPCRCLPSPLPSALS